MPDYDIDIVDEARRVYNRPCSNRPELDAKGYDKTKEAVATKAADYFACFASRMEVLDVVSQRPILADATAFRARFQTVFRESGRELQLRVLARLVFAPKKPSGTVWCSTSSGTARSSRRSGRRSTARSGCASRGSRTCGRCTTPATGGCARSVRARGSPPTARRS